MEYTLNNFIGDTLYVLERQNFGTLEFNIPRINSLSYEEAYKFRNTYYINDMEKTVYIIGHKNPDTDATVSAVGYARLKNLLGYKEYQAARAGHLNPQTAYIFEKFNKFIYHWLITPVACFLVVPSSYSL